MSKILYEVPAPDGLTISDTGVYKIEKVLNFSLKKDMATQIPQQMVDLKTIPDTNRYKQSSETLTVQSKPRLKKQLSIVDERKKVILQNLNSNNFLGLDLLPIDEDLLKIKEKSIAEYIPRSDNSQEVRERKRVLEKVNQKRSYNDEFIIENEKNIPKRPQTFTINIGDQSIETKESATNMVDLNQNNVEKQTNTSHIFNFETENNKTVEKVNTTNDSSQKKSLQIFKFHSLLLLWITLLVLFLILVQAILFTISFSSCN